MSRSSNSPRYFAPATIAARSRLTRRLSRRDSGTSPSTMRAARPSTTAVLPTPGSPMRTGLFFVRRESTWTTRRISESRPMTGSSLPSRAAAVRSVPYCSRASPPSLGVSEVTLRPPRSSSIAASMSRAPRFSTAARWPPSARASRRTSRARWVSPFARIRVSACCRTAASSRPSEGEDAAPLVVGSARSRASAWARTCAAPVPAACRRVSHCGVSRRTRALTRWSGVTSGCPSVWADRWARASASATLAVGWNSMLSPSRRRE